MRTCLNAFPTAIAVLILAGVTRDATQAETAMATTTTTGPIANGFPHGYDSFHRLGISLGEQDPLVRTAYANPLAAQVATLDDLPFPEGAVIVMEFANSVRDGEGQLLRNPDGSPQKGDVAHVDVMRRGPGLGDKYGEKRAGDWEFASYRRDGSTLVAPADAAACAACHRKAGVAADFVFRMRVPEEKS